MARINELNQLYTKADEEFFAYQKRCTDFVLDIKRGIAEYLECEISDIPLFPPKEDYDNTGSVSPRGALKLKDDTFWHFGLGVNLYKIGQKDPDMAYIFEIAFKGNDNKFILKIDADSKEFVINPQIDNDLEQVYEYIYNKIKNRFDNELEKYLNQYNDSEQYRHYN